jgi:hypothetical protein
LMDAAYQQVHCDACGFHLLLFNGGSLSGLRGGKILNQGLERPAICGVR